MVMPKRRAACLSEVFELHDHGDQQKHYHLFFSRASQLDTTHALGWTSSFLRRNLEPKISTLSLFS
jgi:hypothetical protein